MTHVLLTLHHPDHIAGATVERDGHRVARFPKARHVIGAADRAGTPARDLMSPDAEADLASLEGLEDAASDARRAQLGVAVQLGVLERLGLLDLAAGDQEIVPGVTLVHAPGESPGHAIVRVESAGERFYFLGDLLHHPFEIDHPDWVPAGRDPVATRAARERLFADAAASGATLLCAHQPFPGWFRIRREGTRYRWVDG